MLYRALKRLEMGKGEIKAGELFPADKLPARTLATLEARGAIAPLHAPPLSALPGWAARAETLGDIDAGQFLEMDAAAVSAALNVTEAGAVALQAEARNWLIIPPPKG